MTREHKLALIIGFALVLTVGMLLSDHFSAAQGARLAEVGQTPTVLETLAPSDGAQPGALAGAERVRDVSRLAPLLDRPLPDPAQRAASRDPASAQAANPAGRSDGVHLEALLAQREPVSSAPAGFVPAAQPAQTPTVDTPPTRRHQVKPDDTLWSICARVYGDGSLHRQLKAYNADRLGPGGVLRVGATILLPPREMLTGAPQASAGAPAPKKQSTSPKTYVVRKGDTLSQIAQRLLGSSRRMDEILRLNRDAIDDKDDIRVGMRLRLPER